MLTTKAPANHRTIFTCRCLLVFACLSQTILCCLLVCFVVRRPPGAGSDQEKFTVWWAAGSYDYEDTPKNSVLSVGPCARPFMVHSVETHPNYSYLSGDGRYFILSLASGLISGSNLASGDTNMPTATAVVVYTAGLAHFGSFWQLVTLHLFSSPSPVSTISASFYLDSLGQLSQFCDRLMSLYVCLLSDRRTLINGKATHLYLTVILPSNHVLPLLNLSYESSRQCHHVRQVIDLLASGQLEQAHLSSLDSDNLLNCQSLTLRYLTESLSSTSSNLAVVPDFPSINLLRNAALVFLSSPELGVTQCDSVNNGRPKLTFFLDSNPVLDESFYSTVNDALQTLGTNRTLHLNRMLYLPTHNSGVQASIQFSAAIIPHLVVNEMWLQKTGPFFPEPPWLQKTGPFFPEPPSELDRNYCGALSNLVAIYILACFKAVSATKSDISLYVNASVSSNISSHSSRSKSSYDSSFPLPQLLTLQAYLLSPGCAASNPDSDVSFGERFQLIHRATRLYLTQLQRQLFSTYPNCSAV